MHPESHYYQEIFNSYLPNIGNGNKKLVRQDEKGISVNDKVQHETEINFLIILVLSNLN